MKRYRVDCGFQWTVRKVLMSFSLRGSTKGFSTCHHCHDSIDPKSGSRALNLNTRMRVATGVNVSCFPRASFGDDARVRSTESASAICQAHKLPVLLLDFGVPELEEHNSLSEPEFCRNIPYPKWPFWVLFSLFVRHFGTK